MHRPRPRRFARLGNPLLLLLTLPLPALTNACTSDGPATAQSASGSEREGSGGNGASSSGASGGSTSGASGGSTSDASSSTSDASSSTSSSSNGNGGSVTTTTVGSSGTTGNSTTTGNGVTTSSSGATTSGSGSNGGSDGSSSGDGSGGSSTTATTSDGGGGESGASGEGGAAGAGPEHIVPTLGNLVVSVGATLTPVFTPDRQRYSVLPELGQSLDVTAIAGDGLTISIGGEPVESSQPVPVELVETGSELEIIVSNSLGDSQTYTLLVLPTDFPKFNVTTRTPDVSTDPLYVTPSSTYSRYLAKLDDDGVPLFYQAITGRSYDFKKHPNGQMSYALSNESGVDQIVLDPSFDESDVVNCVGANTDHHDLLMLENGNFVAICTRQATRDLSGCGGPSSKKVLDSILQELSPEQGLLFEWNSWDHTDCADAQRLPSGDLAHLNSVVVDTDGDWILSLRYMSQVLKVDRTTGDVIWRLGGLSSDFDFIDDPWDGMCGQHTVARLDNGHLLAFDNGEPCGVGVPDRPQSRVVEYELDEMAMTATVVWSFSREGQYAEHQGSAQRLDNGNTVIGWGADMNSPKFVTEVDAAGNIVFELEATVAGESNSVSYRARRYPD